MSIIASVDENASLVYYGFEGVKENSVDWILPKSLKTKEWDILILFLPTTLQNRGSQQEKLYPKEPILSYWIVTTRMEEGLWIVGEGYYQTWPRFQVAL